MRHREVRAIDSLSMDQPIQLRYGEMVMGTDVRLMFMFKSYRSSLIDQRDPRAI